MSKGPKVRDRGPVPAPVIAMYDAAHQAAPADWTCLRAPLSYCAPLAMDGDLGTGRGRSRRFAEGWCRLAGRTYRGARSAARGPLFLTGGFGRVSLIAGLDGDRGVLTGSGRPLDRPAAHCSGSARPRTFSVFAR
ncbi:hypothetical protein GCM10023191_028730 [Actinoallomurus oryzae]|uniref:Uncharacterized protein n=1 Tax=Actinoallomurus oryzae TaxID=502180 RepID=A0ABP8PWY0_9ACTN